MNQAALASTLQKYARSAPKRLAPWVSLVLAAAIGLVAAKIVWLLVPAPAWQPAPPAPNTTTQRSSTQAVDVRALVAAHLFGEAAPEVANAQPDPVDAPDTTLNLVLKGIFASQLDGESRALIASGRGDEQAYAVGDEISRGTDIYEIYADRVILDRGGRLETLRLEKDKAASPAAAPTRSASRGSSGDVRRVETSQALLNIRETLLADPSKASQYLRVQPAYNAGKLHGYRIYPGRNRSLFNEAGLRPGDLVTELNGTRLDDPSQALQMLGTLSQATSLSVVILRGGQPQTLSLSLN